MIHPYKHCLLIKPDPQKTETKTASGIVFNEEQLQRDGRLVKALGGEVLAVGPETGIEFKPGMRAHYNSYDAYFIGNTDIALLYDRGLLAIEVPDETTPFTAPVDNPA